MKMTDWLASMLFNPRNKDYDRIRPHEFRRGSKEEGIVLDSFCFYGVKKKRKDISVKRYRQIMEGLK